MQVDRQTNRQAITQTDTLSDGHQVGRSEVDPVKKKKKGLQQTERNLWLQARLLQYSTNHTATHSTSLVCQQRLLCVPHMPEQHPGMLIAGHNLHGTRGVGVRVGVWVCGGVGVCACVRACVLPRGGGGWV